MEYLDSDIPLVKGGQGRSNAETTPSAGAVVWLSALVGFLVWC